MQTSSQSGPGLVIGVLLTLLIASYLGSYVILVNPDRDAIAVSQGNVLLVLESPNYLLGGDWAAWFFWPLEQLDRRLRPDTWWMC